MKRTGLTLVAVFCLAASTFASDNQPVAERWNSNINVSKLSSYLQLTANQSEEVSDICDYFTTQMNRATSSKKNQEVKLQTAVYGNLKLMKQTLNNEQYAKYVTLMNATLKNRGIELSK
jgi:undecaprenyl pyrophosphate synthase